MNFIRYNKLLIRFAVLIILIILPFFLFGCNPADSGEDAPDIGFLKVDGVKVFDEYGNTVYLRGVNAGGYLIQEEWMCPTEMTDQISMLTELKAGSERKKRRN